MKDKVNWTDFDQKWEVLHFMEGRENLYKRKIAICQAVFDDLRVRHARDWKVGNHHENERVTSVKACEMLRKYENMRHAIAMAYIAMM